eukprot:jgi/Mesvir1/14579/Mv05256-RA.1
MSTMGDRKADCLKDSGEQENAPDVIAKPRIDGIFAGSHGQVQAIQPVKRAKFLSLPVLAHRTAGGIGHQARAVLSDSQLKVADTAPSDDVIQQPTVAIPPQVLEELYDLNADLLLKVFSFLELEDLCRCAGVSKRWMQASRDPAFWHTLDFSRRKIRPRQVLTLCARYTNATSLNLVGVRNVDAALVRDALGHLTSLVSLSVGDGVIGPLILDEISRACPPTLRSLAVTDAVLGQSVVSDLSLSNASLTELNLTRCRGVRLQLTLPQLTKLVLSGSGLSVVTMAGRPYTSLMHVDLSDCIKLSDASMSSLLSQCPVLTYLDLSGCVSVSDETLQALARHCPELLDLSVSRCPNVALEEVHLPSLRTANLTGCVGMNSDGARASLDGWTCLEDLRLDDCILLPSLRLQLPRLRKLSLHNCHKLASLHVCAPRLVSLDLSHCCLLSRVHLASEALTRLEWVGLFSLAHVTLSCPALSELKIANCDALLASVFDTLRECPSLATLAVDNCDGLVSARVVGCPVLSTLQLTMCKSLGSLHVAAPALTQLSLEGSAMLSSVTLDPVGLKQLNLGICPHLGVLRMTAPAMERLELRGCGVLSDVTVCAPCLSSLDASYCSRLTESFLSNVVASCPRLTSLTLASCPGVLPSLPTTVNPGRQHTTAVPSAQATSGQRTTAPSTGPLTVMPSSRLVVASGPSGMPLAGAPPLHGSWAEGSQGSGRSGGCGAVAFAPGSGRAASCGEGTDADILAKSAEDTSGAVAAAAVAGADGNVCVAASGAVSGGRVDLLLTPRAAAGAAAANSSAAAGDCSNATAAASSSVAAGLTTSTVLAASGTLAAGICTLVRSPLATTSPTDAVKDAAGHSVSAAPAPAPAGCLSRLSSLRCLTTLDLSYTEVRTLGDVFAACASLQVLQLSACKWLVRDALAPLCESPPLLPHLHTLDVSYCHVDVVFGASPGHGGLLIHGRSSIGSTNSTAGGVASGSIGRAQVVALSPSSRGHRETSQGDAAAATHDPPMGEGKAIVGTVAGPRGGGMAPNAAPGACLVMACPEPGRAATAPTVFTAATSGKTGLRDQPSCPPSRLVSPLGRLRCINVSGNKLVDDRLWAFLDEEAEVVRAVGAHQGSLAGLGAPEGGGVATCEMGRHGAHVTDAGKVGEDGSPSDECGAMAQVGAKDTAVCAPLLPAHGSCVTASEDGPVTAGASAVSPRSSGGSAGAASCDDKGEPPMEGEEGGSGAMGGSSGDGAALSASLVRSASIHTASIHTGDASEGSKRAPTLLALTCVACPGLLRVSLASRRGLGALLGSLSLRLSRVASVTLACPWLTTLDLGDCGQLAELVLDCPRLDSLSLQGCASLRAEVLVGALRGAPALETLDLRGCGQVAQAGVPGLYALCQGLCRVYQ